MVTGDEVQEMEHKVLSGNIRATTSDSDPSNDTYSVGSEDAVPTDFTADGSGKIGDLQSSDGNNISPHIAIINRSPVFDIVAACSLKQRWKFRK